MVGLVDDDALQQFVRATGKLRLTPVLVVRDGFELESALAVEAPIIAIENRDPVTGAADLGITERLAEHIPGDVPVIAHMVCNACRAEQVAAGADAALFEPPVDYDLARDAIRDLRGVPAPGRDAEGRPLPPETLSEES